MELLLRIVMYMVLSSLLVYSAYSDYRTRRIPFGVGLGLLLTAAVILVIEKMYWEALFLVVAVIGSRGGMWSLCQYSGLMYQAYSATMYQRYSARMYQFSFGCAMKIM